jgi:hypothetical protein
MSTLVGFGTFTALVEEQVSEKISRRILSGDQGMIVDRHVCKTARRLQPSRANLRA